MANRDKVIQSADLSTPVVSDPIDISVFGQLSIEISTLTVGTLTLKLEFSPDGDAFYRETIEDPAANAAADGELIVPLYMLTRIFAPVEDANISFVLPCAGFKALRITASSDSGGAIIYVNKLRLASN